LSAEEGDEVAIDFAQAGNDLGFEAGGAQWEVVAPVLLDGGAFLEEVVEVEWDEEEADEVAEGTGGSLEGIAEKGEGAGSDFVAVAGEPAGQAGVGERLALA
jgi:hypothetical protein